MEVSESGNPPHLEWRWAAPAVDSSVIAVIERAWKIRFPHDYLNCAKENHGGHPNIKCFDVPGRGEAVLSHLLPFTAGEDMSITQEYEAVSDRLPRMVFPFAADPFGNLLCFDYRNDKEPVVVFWDHEVAYSDPNRAIVYVCATFTELLNMLRPLD